MKKILDQYGNPIDLSGLKSSQTEALASIRSLQSEHDEHPARNLTPSRIHAILRQAEAGDWLKQIELADDMEERDTQIFSELDKRRKGLLKLDWDIAPPADASPAEEQQAEQVKAWITSIKGFKRTVLWDLTDAIFKGFAAIEMTWELRNGALQPSFTTRPPRWFCLSEPRTTIHLRDHSAYGQPLRRYNWLLHKHPARSGYPARQALCRVLMFPFLYKNYSTRDLAEFLEIYGLPLRLGKYPGGATDKEKLTLLRAVTEIGHNAAGIIPEGMSIEFQNAAQGTQVPFEAMLNRMDAAISKAIIGQTLTSGEGQHGTQALGSVHNDIRLDILASDAELLSETLTDQLIAPLALLNIPGADPQRLPRFVLEVPEPEDIKLMAEALPKLAAAGVQIGSDWTAHKLRIPKLDPGEEPLKGIAAKTDPADPAADPAKPDTKPPGKANTPAAKAALQQLSAMPAAAAQATSTEQRDALDDLADDATREWQPLMEPLVQPILAQLQAALARGDTLEQFAAQLTAEFTQSLNATALTEQLARAQFVATLAGTAELEI